MVAYLILKVEGMRQKRSCSDQNPSLFFVHIVFHNISSDTITLECRSSFRQKIDIPVPM